VPRVLLVEDDDNIRSGLRSLFESADYVVDDANNGDDALQLARRIQPDVATSSKPNIEKNVPFSLLAPSIPFTNNTRVTFREVSIFFVNRHGVLAPVRRLLSSSDLLLQELVVMTQGPTAIEASEGFTTATPPSLRVNQAIISHGVALIALNQVLRELSPVAQQRVVYQILRTALAAGATRGIEISVNQIPYVYRRPGAVPTRLITLANVGPFVRI